MATDLKSGTIAFDRRQVYRPFLERLNPVAPVNELVDHDLIVPRHQDPREAGQPPIHVAFANAAELSRGTQMALVGGIGSGKTTELLLTQRVLSRHSDAVNILVDLADYTDLSALNTGAILATVGMRLYSRLKRGGKTPPQEITSAHAKLRELALGKTTWVPEAALDDDYGEEPAIRVDVPGLI